MKAKIEELEKRIEELSKVRESENIEVKYDTKLVTSEGEIIELAKLGYDCQPIGAGKWLMKRPTKP